MLAGASVIRRARRPELPGRPGAPLRSLTEWMGHSNIQTTLIYADYVHDAGHGAALAARAFAAGVIGRVSPARGIAAPLS
jgi:hypothetical protein